MRCFGFWAFIPNIARPSMWMKNLPIPSDEMALATNTPLARRR